MGKKEKKKERKIGSEGLRATELPGLERVKSRLFAGQRQLYRLCRSAAELRESFLHIIALPLALLWVKPCQHSHDKLPFWKVFNLTIKMCLRAKLAHTEDWWAHLTLLNFFSAPEENSTPGTLVYAAFLVFRALGMPRDPRW